VDGLHQNRMASGGISADGEGDTSPRDVYVDKQDILEEYAVDGDGKRPLFDLPVGTKESSSMLSKKLLGPDFVFFETRSEKKLVQLAGAA
jgi:hypothetical protein